MSEDKSKFYPLKGYTKSFWLSEEDNDPFSSHRSTPELPEEVDVLIIGSGYSGSSTAHYLFENKPRDLKVALFEARNVCSGATGRNGGHLKPYYFRYYDIYLKLCNGDEKKVAEIINSEFDHLWAIKNIVDDNDIECDFFLSRACDIYPVKGDSRAANDLKCAKLMLKNPYVYKELKDQLQILYGEAAKIVSKNPTTEIAVTYPAANLWPWKLMTALLKKCVSKGLNLQTNTLVTNVKKNSDDTWSIQTKDRGTTIAKRVVFCTNGYTKALLKEFEDVIVPQRGACCRIIPTDKTAIPHLTNSYGIFSSLPSDYLINRVDGSIIVGGRDDSMIKDNGDFSEWFDCVDDTYVNQKSKDQFSHNYMADRFTTWKKTPTELSHIWTGVLGFTNDYFPYVGELDVIGKKNCYISAGFHGHGMPRVLFCGKAIAKCILENKSIQEIDYTMPTRYAVTKERMTAENIYRKGIEDYAKKYYPKSKL